MTDIRMDWSGAGAIVSFTSTVIPSIGCPRCGATVESGAEHRCGDKALPSLILPKPVRKLRKAKGGAR